MSQLDHVYIKAAIEGNLGDTLEGSAVRFVRSGDVPPEGVDTWARIVAVDIDPAGRNRTNEPNDRASFTVTINVAVGAGQTNAHALAGALALVARALDEWTDDDTGSSGHLVELDRAKTAMDPGTFEEEGIRTGVVSVDGRAQRATGVAFLDVLS